MAMKKCLLFIFLLVFCFHDSIEYKKALDFRMNPKSLIVSYHSHLDDVFDLPAEGNTPVCSICRIVIESSLNLPKENYSPIWKPPVISLL